MSTPDPNWLLLIVSLPTAGATARMRLWRSIKALGCVPVRDGAYLLPDRHGHAAALADLAAGTNGEGGQAWLVDVAPRSAGDAAAFVALFDRSAEYGELEGRLSRARKVVASQSPADVSKSLNRLRKEWDAVQRIDFFPNDASLGAQAAWSDFEESANAVLAPGEPHADERPIARLKVEDYQGRTWATRRKLWVDRVASAWLIQRYIDPQAKFLWLDTPADCPKEALGFDFDGAAFTHAGDKVTFEVLLESFGLEQDAGLAKLAALVHSLDVGGLPIPEGAGFEAILSGTRFRLSNDDALLDEIGAVLDSLHLHYSKNLSS